MKIHITHGFQGYINGIKFEDKKIFFITNAILDKIEQYFGEIYTNELIIDLANTVEKYKGKTFDFSTPEFEENIIYKIHDAQSFETIQFTPEHMYQKINKKLKEGKYTKI